MRHTDCYIVYGTFLSLLAGFITALVARRNVMMAVYFLATIQLALAVGAEVSYWELMPVWYHLIYLILVVPATIYGGRVRMKMSEP